MVTGYRLPSAPWLVPEGAPDEEQGWVLSWLPVEARGRQAPDLLLFCPAGQALSLAWVESRAGSQGSAGNLRESSATGPAKFLLS